MGVLVKGVRTSATAGAPAVFFQVLGTAVHKLLVSALTTISTSMTEIATKRGERAGKRRGCTTSTESGTRLTTSSIVTSIQAE